MLRQVRVGGRLGRGRARLLRFVGVTASRGSVGGSRDAVAAHRDVAAGVGVRAGLRRQHVGLRDVADMPADVPERRVRLRHDRERRRVDAAVRRRRRDARLERPARRPPAAALPAVARRRPQGVLRGGTAAVGAVHHAARCARLPPRPDRRLPRGIGRHDRRGDAKRGRQHDGPVAVRRRHADGPHERRQQRRVDLRSAGGRRADLRALDALAVDQDLRHRGGGECGRRGRVLRVRVRTSSELGRRRRRRRSE